MAAHVGDGDDAPEVAFDHDRSGNHRDGVGLTKRFSGRTRRVLPSARSARAGRPVRYTSAEAQEAVELPASANRDRPDALAETDEHHPGAARLEAGDGGAGAGALTARR
jgi:hypothetical protein